MPELTGSLASIDLAQLVRFLSAMGKTGDVVVTKWPWVGELALDGGRLIGAAVEHEQGANALEFIAVALRGGTFEFTPTSGPPSLSPSLPHSPDPITELERLATATPRGWLTMVESPLATPHVAPVRPSVEDAAAFTLDHATVYVLLDIDGQRAVRDLAARHGLLRTLQALERLRGLGLVAFNQVAPEPPASPPPYVPPQGRLEGRLAPQPALTPGPNGRFRAWRDRLARVGSLWRRSGLVQALIVSGVLVLGIRTLVQNFRVEGISMLPNFGAGQVLVVSRAAYFHVELPPFAALLPTSPQGSTHYLFGGPQRGDVAVFHARVEPGVDFIKRIVGLPGDRVQVRAGRVYVNDEPLDEPYVEFPATYSYPPHGAELIVPDGQYFVLGDNRPDSFDSHTGWFVSVDDLIGRAWIRYWPPQELAMVQSGVIRVAQGATESSAAASRSTNGLP